MDTRKLRYFVRIVDAGSISRAADFLNLAQPALSQQMASLEMEFDCKLLVRTRRGVYPTAEGMMLYRYAQGMLRLERAATLEIKRGSQGVSGFASVGLGTFSCANEIGAGLLRRVQQLYPGIALHFVDNLSVIFSQAIKMGLLDAAIIYEPGPIRGVRFEDFRTEDIVLVASAATRVVEDGLREISLDEVSVLELLLPQSDHILRQTLERGFYAADLQLEVRTEVSSSTGLFQMVKAGLGATCLPRSVAEELFPGDDFQILRIVEPSMSVTFALCTSERAPMSDAAASVIELLRDEIADVRRRDALAAEREQALAS